MLRILGSPKRLCNGLTRREALVAGGLGLCGLPLGAVLPASQASPAKTTDRSFGKAKNVILLYLFGGPSQLETFDPKPDAPPEVRGPIRSIRSSLPGCNVAEYLPSVAKIMDRCTVVRSLTHPWNFHGMQWATTGISEGSIPIEETQKHALHQPFLGSVAAYAWEQRLGPKTSEALPDNVALPFLLSTRRPAAMYARPHSAGLGNAYDPLWTEFRGKATRSTTLWTNGPREVIHNPYLGITAGSRFDIAPEAEMPADITLDRLNRRRSLLDQFDAARSGLEQAASARSLGRQRELAFSLVNSNKAKVALDLGREPLTTREAYGMTLFGQSALQARRLVESGCRFVTVIWDEFGQLNSAWDTHVDSFNRLKNDLLPGLDLAYSALIKDLESRGMLDETLVLLMSEMGRTPKLDADGRGHWGRAYTNVFAGAGLKHGTVIGKTDAIGGTVVERPLSAKDILATIYHLLGVDPHTMLRDKFGRPVPLVPYGDVVRDMLG